jgi:hypothetical protein
MINCLKLFTTDASKTDSGPKEPRISPEERRRQIEEEKARKKKERQEVENSYFELLFFIFMLSLDRCN